MMTRKDYISTAEILKYQSNKIHPAVFSKVVNDFAEMFKVKRIQELRRSNAAQPVRNKKKYTRKIKHKNKLDN